jgi:hypothetical protein
MFKVLALFVLITTVLCENPYLKMDWNKADTRPVKTSPLKGEKDRKGKF